MNNLYACVCIDWSRLLGDPFAAMLIIAAFAALGFFLGFVFFDTLVRLIWKR